MLKNMYSVGERNQNWLNRVCLFRPSKKISFDVEFVWFFLLFYSFRSTLNLILSSWIRLLYRKKQTNNSLVIFRPWDEIEWKKWKKKMNLIFANLEYVRIHPLEKRRNHHQIKKSDFYFRVYVGSRRRWAFVYIFFLVSFFLPLPYKKLIVRKRTLLL